MSEPLTPALGTVSAVTGITSFAFQSVKSLCELIQSFNDYPETVESLQVEIHSLLPVLRRIRQSSFDKNVLAELEPILKACDKACKGLQDIINRCTTHPGGNKPNIVDWTKMRFLGGSIEEFKERLASYNGTILIIINIIDL